MGADYYESADQVTEPDVELGIGTNCHIEGAIIDKNARIGHDVVIKPFPRGTELDGDRWVVRDGIVVIPKNTVLPPKTRIAP
jgi:glucose-1-phosphate adenylyltransferase